MQLPKIYYLLLRGFFMFPTAIYLDNAAHGEDAVVRRRWKDALLVGVFDGVTMAEGAAASSKLKEHFTTIKRHDGLDLAAELRRVHEALITSHAGHAQSTAALALIAGEDLTICTVGDSPAILFTNTGDAWRAERLTPLDRDANEPALLTQVVGADTIVAHTRSVKADGVLLLASDGITDNLSIDELTACIMKTPSPKRILDRIRRAIEKRRSKDSSPTFSDGFKEDDRCALCCVLTR